MQAHLMVSGYPHINLVYRINSASQEWLDGTRLPKSQRDSSEVSPKTADGEATADQQKATVIANA